VSWVSQFIPEALLIIMLVSTGILITWMGVKAASTLSSIAYETGLTWTQPLPYQGTGEWIIQVNLIHPTAWSLGVGEYSSFTALRRLSFMTTAGVMPGYALDCGNYTVDGVFVDYCTFIVKAYPLMPLTQG